MSQSLNLLIYNKYPLRQSLHCTVQEGHDLASGACGVGAKLVGTCAFGDIIIQRPADSFVIVGVGFHISEGVACTCRLRLAVVAPEKCYDLTASAAGVRTEGGFAGSGGDSILDCP